MYEKFILLLILPFFLLLFFKSCPSVDYLVFRFLTISMIIQYKPQTATGGITPRLAQCPILKRQTVFPNSHSQFQFASIINNNQMNDATIIILCKIVVLRIISKKPIISPYLFYYLVIIILITFSNPL